MTDRRSKRAPRPPVTDRPRRGAYEVLKTVRTEDAYANLVLPAVITHFALDGRDAAFTTELASGTLRGRGTYDAIIGVCAERSLNKIQPPALDTLRLGCHQLLAMRVPDHAAIDTSVDLAKAVAGPQAGGFVNAVLRKVSQRTLEEWLAELVAAAPEEQAALAVAHSHPQWIVRELERAVGPEQIDDLLAANNVSPAVTLVARPGLIDRSELPGEPTRYSPYGTVLDSGRPQDIEAIADARAVVQDEGSQLVALALARVEIDGPDARWLDLCSGPGGKAALLAGLAAERGAVLVAAERQQHRSRLVTRALGDAPGVVGVVTADGISPPFESASFDRVLVDAPCTGLGALRRRPEARWRRREEDLLTLVLTQRKLLASALHLVRPGGVVGYVTCSPVFAETKDVVAAEMSARKDVELIAAPPLLPEVPEAEGPMAGTVQLWPHRHGTDAMFLALLRRST